VFLEYSREFLLGVILKMLPPCLDEVLEEGDMKKNYLFTTVIVYLRIVTI